MWVLCWSLFWYSLLCVLFSFANMLTGKRELVDLLLLSFGCLVNVTVFPHGGVVGLQSVIVVFPDHTQLLFEYL